MADPIKSTYPPTGLRYAEFKEFELRREIQQIEWILRELRNYHAAAIIDLQQDAWDDLRFPASGFNPPGGASDPDYDTTNGGWLFAASGTELLFMQVQLEHKWKEGSTLRPHVHWQKTTSAGGDVVWELAYKWAPIGEVMDAAFTTVTASAPVAGTPDNDTADEHLITSFGDMTATGKELSDMIMVRLSRLGSDGDDTYGADCRLLEFDIHFVVDSRGSDSEFVQ